MTRRFLTAGAAFLLNEAPFLLPFTAFLVAIVLYLSFKIGRCAALDFGSVATEQILNLRLRLLFQRGLFLGSLYCRLRLRSLHHLVFWSFFTPGIATIGGACRIRLPLHRQVANDRLVFLLELFGLLLLCRFHWRFPSAPAVSKQMLFIMQSARQTRARAAETVTYYKRVAYYLFVRTTDSSVSAPRLN